MRASVELDKLKAYKTEAESFATLVMSDESKALRSIFFATTEMKKSGVTMMRRLSVKQPF